MMNDDGGDELIDDWNNKSGTKKNSKEKKVERKKNHICTSVSVQLLAYTVLPHSRSSMSLSRRVSLSHARYYSILMLSSLSHAFILSLTHQYCTMTAPPNGTHVIPDGS